MPKLAYTSATELAASIRRREVSSRELVEYFLERIARLDQPINSIVTLDAERAYAEAAAADAALARGEVRGPLHGVPMTVKDSFQTAGMRTTSGAPALSASLTRRVTLSPWLKVEPWVNVVVAFSSLLIITI